MRSIILLIVFAGFLTPATCCAELRVIGVRVAKDTKAEVRVSIFSAVEKENKANLAVKDAVAILQAAEGWGSSVKVGLLVRDAPLSAYLPLLNAISQNAWLELAFIEGEKPNFVHDNIRKIIAEGERKQVEATSTK